VARAEPFREELMANNQQRAPIARRPTVPAPLDRSRVVRWSIAGALMALILVCVTPAFVGVERAMAQSNDIDEAVNARGIAPKLQLTAAQRNAIYQEVHKDTSKVAPSRFAAHVGADVPPMIELYTLPDDILANNPDTKLYKFTRVDDQIVLVDPVKMRVIAVIGPKPKE
jgi:Protein of unknown function (DUF1236)